MRCRASLCCTRHRHCMPIPTISPMPMTCGADRRRRISTSLGSIWGQAYPEAKAYLRTASSRKLLVHHGLAVGPGFLQRALPNLRSLLTSRDTASRARYRYRQQHSTYRRATSRRKRLAAAFKNATPKDHIGGSALLVYEGDFDTSLDAATGERNLAMHAASAGQLSAALEHGKRAVELAPASALAHA